MGANGRLKLVSCRQQRALFCAVCAYCAICAVYAICAVSVQICAICVQIMLFVSVVPFVSFTMLFQKNVCRLRRFGCLYYSCVSLTPKKCAVCAVCVQICAICAGTKNVLQSAIDLYNKSDWITG